MSKISRMKKVLLTICLLTLFTVNTNSKNIFLSKYETPHEVIPFSQIEKKNYEEAIDIAIKENRDEIDKIVNNQNEPSFENTIVAMERSGSTLNRVLSVFYPLLSADADDELMEISMRISPKLSELSTDISLNEGLWKKIQYVYNNCNKMDLDVEDAMLLKNTYNSFARSGALLEGEDREEYKKLSSELSALTLQYGQNALKALNQCEMWLFESDLAGLPTSAINTYKQAASDKGREGEYLVTASIPSYGPFVKYSSRRDLRERIYKIANSRGLSGEYSNVDIMKNIADIRRRIANLLGYETFADYKLELSMAQNTQNVYKLLDQLRDAYIPVCEKEMEELTTFARELEKDSQFTIMPWDYSYYSNKLKDAKYSIDDEILRPYFELSNTIKGVFGLATKLYGLQFAENKSYDVYHKDVSAYDVTDSKGEFVGVLYTDFFPRESKRAGAWMTNFKEQYVDVDGYNSRPLVTIVMNFTKPTGDTPSLLTYSEVETFLHEFGHALHGLLANSKYASISGTNVYRDFVELPSQFNENYLSEKEFLDTFARHYITGEQMPNELIEKIVASAQYGAAYACMRQLSFGYLDMAWHTITAPVNDAIKFEYDAMNKALVFPPVEGCAMSPQFSHIFAGGYAAGYYSYKWAEVLDADAFASFKEKGIFDAERAESFKTNILQRGGSEHPMILYKRFRGMEPSIDALLIRDGIVKQAPKDVDFNRKD